MKLIKTCQTLRHPALLFTLLILIGNAPLQAAWLVEEQELTAFDAEDDDRFDVSEAVIMH